MKNWQWAGFIWAAFLWGYFYTDEPSFFFYAVFFAAIMAVFLFKAEEK